jgi:hypothetical protein
LKQFNGIVPQNFAECKKGQYRDKVALKLGVSGWHYEKAKKVYLFAPEEIKERWRKGETLNLLRRPHIYM